MQAQPMATHSFDLTSKLALTPNFFLSSLTLCF
jgi:hypothetical protein